MRTTVRLFQQALHKSRLPVDARCRHHYMSNLSPAPYPVTWRPRASPSWSSKRSSWKLCWRHPGRKNFQVEYALAEGWILYSVKQRREIPHNIMCVIYLRGITISLMLSLTYCSCVHCHTIGHFFCIYPEINTFEGIFFFFFFLFAKSVSYMSCTQVQEGLQWAIISVLQQESCIESLVERNTHCMYIHIVIRATICH